MITFSTPVEPTVYTLRCNGRIIYYNNYTLEKYFGKKGDNIPKILRHAQQRMFGGSESNGFGVIIGSNIFEVDRVALNFARKFNINVNYLHQWEKEIENMREREYYVGHSI